MKAIIFLFATIFLIWFSWWFSIKHKRYHGIYRFFAFESIVALLLINHIYWNRQPIIVFKLLSWFFLYLSLIYVIWGVYCFLEKGKPVGSLENTTNLVTTGIYKFIRHPMYASLLFLGTGIFLKYINYLTVVLALINLVALNFTAKTEEGEMLKKFGRDYKDYKKNSKMFIPFLY